MVSQSQSQNTSTEDSRFTELLKPIKDLTQNFEVPLFNILEKYIDQLREMSPGGTAGTASGINFAEAAFIIQNTVNVYGKKVDFLHEKSLSVLATLASGPQGGEGGPDGEGNEPVNKKRRGAARPDLDFGPIKVEIGKNISLKPCQLSLRELQDRLGFIQITPRQLVEKESIDHGAAKIDLYFGPKFELLGAKKDFRLNSQYSSATGMLGEGLTAEAKIIEEDVNNSLNMDSSTTSSCVAGPEADCGGSDEVTVAGEPVLPALLQEQQAPADPGGQQEAEEREVVYDIGTEDVAEADNDGGDISERREGQAVRGGRDLVLRRSATPPLPVIRPTTPEVDPWEPINPFSVLGTPRSIGRGQTIRPPPPIKKQHAEEKGKRSPRQLEKISISELIGWGTEEKTVAKRPEFRDLILPEWERRRDIERRLKRDRDRQLVAEEEPGPEAYHSDREEEGEEEDLAPAPEEPVVAAAAHDGQLDLPDPHLGGDLGPALDLESVEPPAPGDTTNSYEDLVRQRVQEFLAKSAAYVASSDLARKVSAWHEMIAPRLELVEQRSEFDIHAYGTQILNTFGGRPGAVRSFGELMVGRPREEVARYFLSSLMLANCMNLEIMTEEEEGEEGSSLAMDNMRLRFLSEKRHHEELEEFQAASQQQRDSSVLGAEESNSQFSQPERPRKPAKKRKT